MIPSYTCLAQNSPEPAGPQRLGFDHQRTAHRLNKWVALVDGQLNRHWHQQGNLLPARIGLSALCWDKRARKPNRREYNHG